MTGGGENPFVEFRKDGWPLCPNCKEDELWCPGSTEFYMESGRNPTIEECIKMGLGCYWCRDWFGKPDSYISHFNWDKTTNE